MALTDVRRRFADENAIVLHFYGASPAHVDQPARRVELWDRIEPIMRGQHDVPFSDVQVYEYRDNDRRTLLAVQETC